MRAFGNFVAVPQIARGYCQWANVRFRMFPGAASVNSVWVGAWEVNGVAAHASTQGFTGI